MRSLLFILLLIPWLLHGQWVQQADFPGLPRDDAAVLLRTTLDLSFVGTGRDVGFNLTNDWYGVEVNSGTANWQQVASLPSTGRQYCTALGEQTTLLFGGQDANGALSELWEYGPGSDTWFQRASLPSMGRYACAGFFYANIGYVIGGILDDGTVSNEVWKYDYLLDAWTQLADFPGTPRHRAMYSDAGIIAGGADSLFSPLDDTWIFDFQTEAWSSVASLPMPLYGAAAASDYPCMIVAGGVSTGGIYQDGLWRYSILDDQWYSYLSPLPSARKGSALIINTAWIPVIQFGLGIDSANTRFNDWWWHMHTLSVHETEVKEFTLYPNPTSSLFTIKLNADFRDSMIRCEDLLGKEMYSALVVSQGTIPTEEWESGVYVVTVINGNGNTVSQRLIVP